MDHRYDIWFGGEPPPTVTWEREGTVIQVTLSSFTLENRHHRTNVDLDLQPNERITLELMAKKTVYCERNTVIIILLIRIIIMIMMIQVLTVKKADRAADTGLYRIRLTCEGGR